MAKVVDFAIHVFFYDNVHSIENNILSIKTFNILYPVPLCENKIQNYSSVHVLKGTGVSYHIL